MALGSDGEKYYKKLDFKSRICVEKCPTDNSMGLPCLSRAVVSSTLTGQMDKDQVIKFEIMQSVSEQPSYPTEVWKNRLCVPLASAPDGIRDEVIAGRHKLSGKVTTAIASVTAAWPLFIAVASIAAILGYLFLWGLRKVAGPMIMVSLCLSVIISVAIAVFFLIGLFFSPYDNKGWYYQLNPIFLSIYGETAKVVSFLVGVLALGMAWLLGTTTKHAYQKIDESMGLIYASTECIFDRNSICVFNPIVPLIGSAANLVVIAILAAFYSIVSAVGDFKYNDIKVNSEYVESLGGEVIYPKHWTWALNFYIFMSIWILEVTLGMTQMVISYVVCTWFFTPITRIENTDISSMPFRNAYQGFGEHVDNIRVHGVDGIYGGYRGGYIEHDTVRGRGKVLVVPMGWKHPNGRDFLPEVSHFEEKPHSFITSTEGLCCAITHLGGILKAAWPILLTRPFRMVSNLIRFFMTSAKRDTKPLIQDPKENQSLEEDPTTEGILWAFAGLYNGFVNHYFGGFCKDAYVDMILHDSDFAGASREVNEFITRQGGTIAFLHGTTSVYEMIAICLITLLSAGTGFILLTCVEDFSSPQGKFYVEDPFFITAMCTVIASMVSFMFMSLFNNTADTLLYVFAFARKHARAERMYPLVDPNDPDRVTPMCLLDLFGKEMLEAPNEVFKASAASQMTRLHHAHKRFAGTAYNFVTGNHSTILHGNAERETLLKKSTTGRSGVTGAPGRTNTAR
eukprot:TRINITY_DN9459_c0_g5_i1.p1 TRINITY_DN9459_c0_g5~~TRINITY_DN9459_c0_g5_i1.p1  ORF type:complete len:862 (-),score=104.07 TRINITY_DN9459_c0_g5_i1:248-2458(-)